MTNNIVVQFSCSIRSNGEPYEYNVVNGSEFHEEYNETLDSGTIVLSQVPLSMRLRKISPYVFARVFDKSGNTGLDKVFLVDNFNEKEDNITEHIYSYTVKLMSETKILEKIQCPNRTITHSLNANGNVAKKTIFEYIYQYMKLYIPKIKFSNDGQSWSYLPLIKIPGVYEDKTLYRNSIVVNYDTTNFEEHQHGGVTWYIFNCESDSLQDEDIDYDTVRSIDVVPNDDDVDWPEGSPYVSNFDTETGKFSIAGQSNNSYNGSLTIHYVYKKKNYIDVNDAFYKRFNVPCADLSFSAPTLRQLLTTLMQQVGCIPTVKNRTLGFLDFQKDAVLFGNGDYTLNKTVNYIRRSLSSDSYANSLVNMSEQVLDSGNEVICEALCFRDNKNVLLKQEENLCLETSLPIFKVNKCILHGPGKSNGKLCSSLGCFQGADKYYGDWNITTDFPFIFYKETWISNRTAHIRFRVRSRVAELNAPRVIADYIYFWTRNLTTGAYEIVEKRPFGEIILGSPLVTNAILMTSYYDTWNSGSDPIKGIESYYYDKVFENIPLNAVGFFLSGTLTSGGAPNENNSKKFTFIKFDDSDPNVVYHDPYERELHSTARKPHLRNHIWSANDTTETSDDDGAEGVPLMNRYIAAYKLDNLLGFQAWDITKLVVENSARQLLETDFQKMGREISSVDDATVEKISKYIYGTVGYSIGSKTISGFSDVFITGEKTALGWVQKNYTYLENIVDVLEKDIATSSQRVFDVLTNHFEGLENAELERFNYGNQIDHIVPGTVTITSTEYWDDSKYLCSIGNAGDYAFIYYDPVSNSFSSSKKFFTAFFVDLYYQPLNSFNLSYVKGKEDIDFLLEQYDSNDSGVTDFDRLSIHEQEKVDRIGNEVLSISQRATKFSEIQTFENGPLLFRDDTNKDGAINEEDNQIDYIIFKRSFTVNNNCFDVSYVGSKDSVLKDYFTSIRTKYRAYQYVDYSQSVLRKEKDVIFVRVANDIFDGDDKIRLGDLGQRQYNDLKYLDYFIYDFEANGNKKPICYEVESGKSLIPQGIEPSLEVNQKVKNSVSLISTKNMISFIYEYNDNIGAGTYIQDIVNDYNLGGIPQTWQIWSEEHNIKHKVYFSNYIGFFSQTISTLTAAPEDYVRDKIREIERSPIISDFPIKTVLWLTDDNSLSYAEDDSGKVFEKDAAERINHTVQFIYYAPNKDVLLSEHFISATPMIGRHEFPFNACYGSDEFKINDLPHALPEGDDLLPLNRVTLRIDNGIPYIKVLFSGYSCIKMCYKNPETDEITDIAVFKNDSDDINKNFYFMINDTKSDYVLSDYHGILYRKYKVATYEDLESGVAGYVPVSDLFPRTVESIYDEED